MAETDAKKEAAERIRNTYPTYSLTGKFIQRLARFPLAGTFVSFPSEIIRTQYHILRYAMNDIKNKNPVMRKLGYRRLFGVIATNGAIYASAAVSAAMFGIGDDEEDAIKRMAAPWNRNSNLLFLGRDDDGQVQYLDLSFLDPYNYFKRPINAMLREEKLDTIVSEAARDLYAPFFSADISAQSVSEMLMNRKVEGGQVYDENDPWYERKADQAMHLAKDLSPGVVNNITGFIKAAQGEVSKGGKEYTLAAEAAALFGFRATTFNPKQALYYRSYEFKDRKAAAHAKVYDVLRNLNEQDPEQVQSAYEATLERRQAAYEDMALLIDSVRATGVSTFELKRLLKDANLSQEDIKALLKGEVPQWSPTNASQRRAMQRALLLAGPDAAKQIEERYRSLR